MPIRRLVSVCAAALVAVALAPPGQALAVPPSAGPGLTLVAGTGTPGFAGDNGPATDARLDRPTLAAAGEDGLLYVVDSGNSRIRVVSPGAYIRTVAGGGPRGTGEIPAAGVQATEVALGAIHGIAVGPDAELYLSDADERRILRIDPAGTMTVLAVAPAGGPEFRPGPLAVDEHNRRLYIADSVSPVVWSVGTSGGGPVVAAGNGQPGITAAGGPATGVALGGPVTGISAESGGGVQLVAGGTLRTLDPARGVLSTVVLRDHPDPEPPDRSWTTADDPGWPPRADSPLTGARLVARGSHGLLVVHGSGEVLRLAQNRSVSVAAPAAGTPDTALVIGRDDWSSGGEQVYLVDPEAAQIWRIALAPAPNLPGEPRNEPYWILLVFYLVMAGSVLLLIVAIALGVRNFARRPPAP